MSILGLIDVDVGRRGVEAPTSSLLLGNLIGIEHIPRPISLDGDDNAGWRPLNSG